jgi:hypothetical protein
LFLKRIYIIGKKSEINLCHQILLTWPHSRISLEIPNRKLTTQRKVIASVQNWLAHYLMHSLATAIPHSTKKSVVQSVQPR